MAEGTKWYAYMEFATADPWFNDAPYVDTLNPDAIADFIHITHDAYQKAIGDEFGKTVPAIFTDEPQFPKKGTLDFALEQKDVILPWTRRLPALYEERYQEDLLDVLPQLFWELPNGQLSPARYRFHNLVADLFATAYTGQIGDWCREHGIALTGHVMGEPSPTSANPRSGRRHALLSFVRHPGHRYALRFSSVYHRKADTVHGAPDRCILPCCSGAVWRQQDGIMVSAATSCKVTGRRL